MGNKNEVEKAEREVESDSESNDNISKKVKKYDQQDHKAFPEEVIIYTIEFMNFEGFIKCHLLNRSINNNLCNSFNCYRLWFSHYKSKIDNFIPQMEKLLNELYHKNQSDVHFWKKKVKEEFCFSDEMYIETTDIFPRSGHEFWYVCFSPDGKKLFGCGENGFTIMEFENEHFSHKHLSSGRNTTYGKFSPDSSKCLVCLEGGQSFVYHLEDCNDNSAPFLDQVIKFCDDFEYIVSILESMIYFDPTLKGDLKPVISIDNSHNFNDGEKHLIRNHCGLYHYLLLPGFTKKPYFVDSEHILYFSNPVRFSNMPEKGYVNKGYEVHQLRVERMNRIYNYVAKTEDEESNKNCQDFRIMNLHLDFKNIMRKMELEIGWKGEWDPVNEMSHRNISISNMEENKMLKGVLVFESGMCHGADCGDTLVLFSLPDTFYDFFLAREDQEEVRGGGDRDGVDINLSDCDYIFLDGSISQVHFEGDRIYVLYRPCDRRNVINKPTTTTTTEEKEGEEEEEEKTKNPICMFYQLCIFSFSTREKIATLTPTVPNVISQETYFIYIDVVEKYISIGSESSDIVIWDKKTLKHLITIKKKFEKPVSSVCFNPKDQNMLCAGSDDGTVRIMHFGEKKLEVDELFETYLSRLRNQKMNEMQRVSGDDIVMAFDEDDDELQGNTFIEEENNQD